LAGRGRADGHHDGETERDDHRPRLDLQERVSLQVAGEISEPHVQAALPAAPADRRREISGEVTGTRGSLIRRCSAF